MTCKNCGGYVEWKGPLANLTHTECAKCGGINCQEAEVQPVDDESRFAVEQLQTCQHGVPCFSRDYGQDVEPCGEVAAVRVRWYDPEEKKWDDWMYLCEEHHAQVAAEEHD